MATPVLDPKSSDSPVSMDVAVSCATAGATIRFTTNGSDPTPLDPTVPGTGVVRMARSAVLKAKAWTVDEESPIAIGDYRITGAIAAGYEHALALSFSGKTWSWGTQTSGRLGNGATVSGYVSSPQRVVQGAGLFDSGFALAAGFDHSVVLDQGSRVWTFGANGDGQLGNNLSADSASPVQVLKSTTAGDYLEGCIDVDAGEEFSIALSSSGTPHAWGVQSTGRLGNGVNSSSAQRHAKPVKRGDDPGYPELTGIRGVGAGNSHGLAREANALEVPAALGRVWVWGHNHAGQLGLGNTSGTTRAFPMKLDANTILTDAFDADGGGNFSVILRWKEGDSNLRGSVWAVGSNTDGRLGNGTTTASTYPVQVIRDDGAILEEVHQISVGSSHTLALDADGHVWAWGNNDYGQLGNGTTVDANKAKLVKDASGHGVLSDIVLVSAGGDGTEGFSMALDSAGNVWTWGRNASGQLGLGSASPSSLLPVGQTQNYIEEGRPSIWLGVSIQERSAPGSAVITAFPQHGSPDGPGAIDRVELFVDGQFVASLTNGDWSYYADQLAGGDHQCVGIVYDIHGETAMSPPLTFKIDPFSQAPPPGGSPPPPVPVAIPGDLAAGGSHVLGVRWNKSAQAWGRQDQGRLGNGKGSGANVVLPGSVMANVTAPFTTAKLAAAGADHSLLLDKDNAVWAFGGNGRGQVGDKSTTSRFYPVKVQVESPAGTQLAGCSQISAGENFSLALQGDVVRCWGARTDGRLGNGTTGTGNQTVASTVVTAVTGYPVLTGIRQIDAGLKHAVARSAHADEQAGATGTVHAWGDNTNGQLGIGDNPSSSRAVPVLLIAGTPLTDVASVSAGGAHTVFLRRSATIPGEVWCVGSERYGRLGNGILTNSNRTYPVKVQKSGGGDLQNVVQISAGPRHTLALDSAGDVWAWGGNASGELGTGFTSDSGVAVKVLSGEFTDIVKVVAGGSDTQGCSFAVTAAGRVYAWGNNANGQLATGNTTPLLTPVISEEFSIANWLPLVKLALHQPDINDGTTVTLVASAIDRDGPSDIKSVTFFQNGQSLGTLYERPWVVPLENLPRGRYDSVQAQVEDLSGGISGGFVSFNIKLGDRQALSPSFPDWDLDGIKDDVDDGGVGYWGYALQNAILENPDGLGMPTGEGVGAMDSNTFLIGVWGFENGTVTPPVAPATKTKASLPAIKGNLGKGTVGAFEFEYEDDISGIRWDRVASTFPLERGMPSAAIHLNRANAYGKLPARNFNDEDDQTWGMWVKFPAGTLSSELEIFRTLFSLRFTGISLGYPDLHCYFDCKREELVFDSYTDDDIPGVQRTRMGSIPIPPELDDGSWHHLTVGFGPNPQGGNGVFKLWVDGKAPSFGYGNTPQIGEVEFADLANAYVLLGQAALGSSPFTIQHTAGVDGHNAILTEQMLGATIDRLRVYNLLIADNDQVKALVHQDADGDGLWDITEYRGYNWRDSNANLKRDPGEADSDPFHWTHPQRDHDNDGLSSMDEQNVHLTDPFDSDSDDDGLTDGFEVENGLPPNQLDLDQPPHNDPDLDNLTNKQEAFYGTKPKDADTDDDGVNDGLEIQWGTDPLNPKSFPPTGPGLAHLFPPGYVPGSLDGLQPMGTLSGFQGQPAPNAPTNQVTVRVGDHSGSASEDWTLWIGERDVKGEKTANPSQQTVGVDRNDWQTIKLVHNGSSRKYPKNPDYDYLATIDAPTDAFVLYDGPFTFYDDELKGFSGELLGDNKEPSEETSNTSWNGREAYLVPIEKRSVSNSISYSGNNATGPKYRKVGLNGRPMADGKPEEEPESDHDSEESYIDAFDLSLRHDNSFIYTPLPSSDLKLQVTASLNEAIWTDRSGIAPAESMTSPFGACWSSNLCSYVEVVESIGGGGADPITINVVDEDGKSQRFTCSAPGEFIPWPSSRTDQKSMLNKLEKTPQGFVLTKRFGNVLSYEPTVTWFAYSSDRKKPNHTGKRHTYWRLKTVEDRFGNHLQYEYDQTGNLAHDAAVLIPRKIHCPERPGQEVLITRNSNLRRVEAVTDNLQHTTNFTYGSVSWAFRSTSEDQASSQPPGAGTSLSATTLTGVSYADGTSVQYSYNVDGDLETRQIRSANELKYRFTDYAHVNLATLTNRRGGVYQFAYTPNIHTFSYSADGSTEGVYAASVNMDGMPVDARDWVEAKIDELNDGYPAPGLTSNAEMLQMHGLPRLVSSVTLPGNIGTAQFSHMTGTQMHFLPDSEGNPSFEAAVGTRVVDAAFGVTEYSFGGLQGEIVDIDIEGTYQGAVSSQTSFSYEWMLYYTGLTLTSKDQWGNVLGSESYAFDLASGLELASATDFSGNTTEWIFDQAIPANTIPGLQALNGGSFMTRYPQAHTKWDPVMDGVGNRRRESFTYHPDQRRMETFTDVHGCTTETPVDELGRPMSKTVTDSDGSVLLHEEYDYESGTFPAFMTRKTVVARNGSADPDWEENLVTEYEPDSLGRVAKEIVDPGWQGLGIETEFTYDQHHNRTSVTDPNGNVTQFHYDVMNRLFKVDYPPTRTLGGDVGFSEYTLYEWGSKAATIDGKGTMTRHTFDPLGRIVATTTFKNPAGTPDSSTSFNSPASTADDIVTSRTYNAVGSITTETDARGSKSMTFYDGLQRTVHVIRGVSASADYVLDAQAADQSNDITHVEFGYPHQVTIGGLSMDANPGGSLFSHDGFKPTMTKRRGATGQGQDYISYAAFDAAYRPVATSEQYAENTPPRVTELVYGPMSDSPVANREPNVVLATDALETQTRTVKDGMGRVTLVQEAFGTDVQKSIQTRYSGTGFAWQTIEQGWRHSEAKFDAAGRLTHSYSPDPDQWIVTGDSPTTVKEYDPNGNVIAEIDPRGNRTEHSYDGRNRRWKSLLPGVTNALDPSSPVPNVHPQLLTYYDAVGNVTWSEDARSSATFNVYDFANRLVESRTDPTQGSPSTGVNPDSSDIVTSSVYDKGGLVLAAIDGNGNITRNSYDLLGRLKVTVVNPDPSSSVVPDPNLPGFDLASYQQAGSTVMVVTNQYNDQGNLIEVKDGKGQVTKFAYDGVGRKTQTIWDAGSTTMEKVEQSFYDALNLTERRDAALRRTFYYYDRLHRLTDVNYDVPAGRVSLDDQKRTYDTTGRLVSVKYPNDPASIREVTYQHDALDRLEQETSAGSTHLYEYDKSGNRLKVTYGLTGRCLESTYDPLNRLATCIEKDSPSSPTGRITSYAYNLRGDETYRSLPNGNSIVTSHDYLGRKLFVTEKTPAQAVVYSLACYASGGGWPYGYDGVGNLLRFSETKSLAGGPSARDVVNTYDRANRLLTEASTSTGVPGYSHTYTYDAANNRTSKTTAGSPTTVYTYGNGNNGYNSNQLISFGPSGGPVTRSYTYDANGNRATRVTGSVTDTYVWDYENRLVSTVLASGASGTNGTYSYRYDYRGRRVVRDESAVAGRTKTVLSFSGGTSVTEATIWELHDRSVDADGDGLTNHAEYLAGKDPLNPNSSVTYTPTVVVANYEEWAADAILERSTESAIASYRTTHATLQSELIRGSDWGGGVGSVVYTIRGSQRSYNSYNSRGDVVSVSDDAGLATWQAFYEGFGTRPYEVGADPGRQRGNTKEEDPTGLLNEGLRFRDLELGMFISRDPAGFVDGPNVYTYVQQNPWTKFDPLGLWGFGDSNGSLIDSAWNAVTAPVVERYNMASSILTAVSDVASNREHYVSAVVIGTVANGAKAVADMADSNVHAAQSQRLEAITSPLVEDGKFSFGDGAQVVGVAGGEIFGWNDATEAATGASLEDGRALSGEERLSKGISATGKIAGTTAMLSGPLKPGGTTARGTAAKSGPFVPEEYWTRNAPSNVTPGTRRLDHTKYNKVTKTYEQSRVTYDEFGRQNYRVDKTDHGRPNGSGRPNDTGHSNPHLHESTYAAKGTRGHNQDTGRKEVKHNLE